MKCDCCGREKKLLEAFASVDNGEKKLTLCVDCNDFLYKLRDAADEGMTGEFEDIRQSLTMRMEGKASEAFQVWSGKFIAKQHVKLAQSGAEIQSDKPASNQTTTLHETN